MATITQIALILSTTGKVDGPIFTRRHSTRVIRRPYPAYTPSPAQLVSRSAFAAVDTAWRHLSWAQRSAWNAYRHWAHKHGYNQFQRINIPRQLAGLPLILHPADIP